MEPQYLGANGYLDAFAAAWLFQEDHLFFRDDEIVWDGTHHDFTGMHTNSETLDAIPEFMENQDVIPGGVMDFLVKLEQREELIVPRASIHEALYPVIREGDLTGLTLFNLLACAKAISIERTGEDTYKVCYDPNLGAGIPGFGKLVGSMIAFMRDYNEVAGEFAVTFAGARNYDFTLAFLGSNTSAALENPVAGAETPGTMHLESKGGYDFKADDGTMRHIGK